MNKKSQHLINMEEKKVYRFNNYHYSQCAYVQAHFEKFQCQEKPYSDKEAELYNITPSLHKYYCRREFLFKKFDQGIKWDEESLYSIIPEDVSLHLLKRMKKAGIRKICQPFCGVGGIAVHLCDHFDEYVVNDLDENKLKMLKKNMKVYDKSQKKLKIQNCDFLKMNPFKTDAIILCPPWGGISIGEYAKRDLDAIMFPKLSAILEHALKFSKNIILQMPKTTNINNLINIVLKCKGLRPIFTVQKIFRNKNELDQLFFYFGDTDFIKINTHFYQMIYDDLGLSQKQKKAKRNIKCLIQYDYHKILKDIYRQGEKSEDQS